MLTLNVAGEELFNEASQEFETTSSFTLNLEHSLLSLSIWEAKFEKPFLSPEDKSEEETLAYVEAMVISENPPENFIRYLAQSDFDAINTYMNSNQTGTTFYDRSQPNRSREIISSELIYYWMVSYRIPFSCESWHLNRLFALIRVCNLKNSKQTKMSRREQGEQNRMLNAQRKAKLGTSG